MASKQLKHMTELFASIKQRLSKPDVDLATTRDIVENLHLAATTYYPWVNRIERLWKTLHDTITRNHRYPTISQLMTGVRRFLHVVQPFPGNQHALARVS